MRFPIWSLCVVQLFATSTLTLGEAQLPAQADNAELMRLFQADQEDRKPGLQSIDWASIKPRDDARLQRTRELYAAGALHTGIDWLNAAFILQHSSEADDYLLAHEMCLAALALGEKNARWLAAASEDRFLRAIGRNQRFGTQYEGGAPPTALRLAPTDAQVTDDLRAAVGVPTLAEAKAKEATFNRK